MVESTDLSEEVLVGISYIPLIIITVGVIFNTAALLVFVCSPKMRKMSSMIFLSFIAIADMLGLFTWNLNHFLQPNHLPSVESISLASCRFFNFLQYFSLQCSGLLYSMISVDRYFTIIAIPGSFAKKLPFGTHKTALIWCISIVVALAIINCHMLFMQGYIKTEYKNITQPSMITTYNITYNRTETVLVDVVVGIEKVEELICFVSEDGKYILNPMWDYVNLAIYNFIPFILMAIFNTLLIIKTFERNVTTKDKKASASLKRKRRLTISLCIITVGFIVMTLPGSILYGFFVDILRPSYIGHAILIACDCFLFSQHAILFFMCFATNLFFREVVINFFNYCFGKICCCKKFRRLDEKLKDFSNTKSEKFSEL